jgi:hypothetical protein
MDSGKRIFSPVYCTSLIFWGFGIPHDYGIDEFVGDTRVCQIRTCSLLARLGFRCIAPLREERHTGRDHDILATRRGPRAQSTALITLTRNWTPTRAMTINLDREAVVTVPSLAADEEPLAG